ncbi:MAG TPA: hypothetical protein PK864_08045 [Syntrophorhabdaceae bacterium]|nr:hypothetical protein [Syntrophorhabdaceae bacterium]HOL06079.1 hypothetical protein [Syntrophorhabdaceae bacterium]HON85965.1 hypothetical protein [Syntrophorhabdaceae bacterium]HOT42523.1 hypothetical protein [Syntrophorhabdaceae bacterium]HPC67542.1 hypothetical protein [Syntrophorhabdaceae bacterium]
MKETIVSDIERLNFIIFIIGSILSLVIMREYRYFFSFAVASAIITLNFRFLKKIIESGFSKSKINKKDLLIKLPLKFFLFAGIVAVIIIYGNIDVIFFLIGLSTLFISVIINQIMAMLSLSIKRRQKNGA